MRQQRARVVVSRYPKRARDGFDVLKAMRIDCIRRRPTSQNRASHPHFRAHPAGRNVDAARRMPRADLSMPKRADAQMSEHDRCALLSFAPCRAMCHVRGGRRRGGRRRRSVADPDAARAVLRGGAKRLSTIACLRHTAKVLRARKTIHVSQHRLAELRDRFGHRTFSE
ncbi:hypothetical protein BLAT2472_20126 [Burkholderia latens]